jgi:hypothetical protein
MKLCRTQAWIKSRSWRVNSAGTADICTVPKLAYYTSKA